MKDSPHLLLDTEVDDLGGREPSLGWAYRGAIGDISDLESLG